MTIWVKAVKATERRRLAARWVLNPDSIDRFLLIGSTSIFGQTENSVHPHHFALLWISTNPGIWTGFVDVDRPTLFGTPTPLRRTQPLPVRSQHGMASGEGLRPNPGRNHCARIHTGHVRGRNYRKHSVITRAASYWTPAREDMHACSDIARPARSLYPTWAYINTHTHEHMHIFILLRRGVLRKHRRGALHEPVHKHSSSQDLYRLAVTKLHVFDIA